MRLRSRKAAYGAVAALLAVVLGYFLVRGGDGQRAPSAVLAKVNGEAITENDVAFVLQRTFSNADLMMAGDDLRHKVLESLVASRAMKQAMARDMSAEEHEQIRRKVRAYKEELLVKEYLQRHATPEPVSTEMVREYYEKNPEQFGAQTVRDFELLKAPAGLDEAARDKLLKAVASIRGEADWSKAAKSWAQQYRLQYQQGRSRAGLLHPLLDQTLQRLDKGATSDVLTVDGQLHLIRVRTVTQTPPKPLSEVSAEIRKRLAPLQLKKAVKQISDQARSEAEVEWMR